MKTTTSNKKVIKAGAGYVIGNYLLKGITFLSAPIFTRLLTTDDYGNFGTYTSYEGIFYIIVGLALHTSINNAMYKYKEKFEEYVSSLVLLTVISTGVWLVLANLFYDSYATTLDFSRLIVNILILHCFGSSMIQFFNCYVSLNYQVKSFLKLTSINALSNMGLSIVLLLTVFRGQRLLGRIIGMAFPIVCISIYITVYFFKKCKPKINKEYWNYGLVYSLPMIPHGISQVILSSFDRIMIKNIQGATPAGFYSFAYTINTLVQVAANSLGNVWRPWFYEKMDQKDYASIRKQGIRFALGMAWFTALVIMVTPELVKILGAREYWNSTNCVIPVVIGGYFSFIYTLPVMVEYFYGKTKYIAVGSVLAAGINILLNYLFIGKYGYIAAAYTTLVTYGLYFMFHYFLAKKIHKSSLFSGLQLFEICVGLLGIGVVGLALEEYMLLRWGLELVIGIIGLLWIDKNFGLKKMIEKKIKG